VSDNQRLEELRRRVARDPASIAFAHLAEEYRRCGRYEEAIETCRTGLEHHGAYLSARVTLARALMELGRFDEAQAELDIVLRTAPENLAAIRTLSEIQRRRGDLPAAADVFSAATLAAAKDQEELEQMVRRLARALDAAPAPPSRASAPPEPAMAVSASTSATPAHARRSTPVPEPDLFTLFGAAIGTESGRFRDTAREEFFAPVSKETVSSRYLTLELKPAGQPEPFDNQLLADLSFRDSEVRPGEDSVGFAPARADMVAGPEAREAEEARKLLLILEQWLVALEA
jgi:tetratricopeptide (TPR) repeat protein